MKDYPPSQTPGLVQSGEDPEADKGRPRQLTRNNGGRRSGALPSQRHAAVPEVADRSRYANAGSSKEVGEISMIAAKASGTMRAGQTAGECRCGRAWSGSRAARSAWAPTGTIPRRRRRIGSGSTASGSIAAGHQPRVPALRQSDRPRHVRRDRAGPQGLSGCAATLAARGLADLQPAQGPGRPQ